MKSGLRLVIALLALLLIGGGATRALAHAALVRSEPADNAILVEAPPEIRLWFSEPLSPEFSSARLLDVNGRVVKLDGLRVDAADAYLLIADPPDLAAGVYSVNWRVLSEADGHVTQGMIVFGVGEGADLSAAAGGEAQAKLPLAEAALRWINFSLLATLTGALAVLRLVLRPGGFAVEDLLTQARLRAWGWARTAAWLGFWAGFLWFGYQFLLLYSSLPAGADPLKVAWQILARTRWGTLWLLRQAALLLAAWTLARPMRAWRYPAAVFLALALIAVQALSGHAAGISPGGALAVLADMLHLLGASLWVGGLLSLAVALFPLMRRQPQDLPALIQATWGGFGRWAALSVGLLAATGFYAAGLQVASLDAFLTTLYGWLLGSKVLLILAVGAVGLLNSMLLHPTVAAPLARLLKRPAGWTPLSLAQLRSLILLEASLGLLIFLAAGALTAAPPARGPEFAPPPAGQALDSMTQTVDDLLINFSAKPNMPGLNVFTVRAASQRRPPPADVLRLILRFTYLGQDLGTVSADAELIDKDLYRLGGGYFSLPGPWQVDVIVRRKGLEDTTARFEWLVPSAAQSRPPVISNQPWSPYLTGAALALLALTLLLWFTLNRRAARR
jgi:copper transport protein